ncbi:fatty acid metabolism transcriptional regulator FadR [Aliiglaciecola sp. CAU 1673]|uniref:fatty acid metabolism transcriptional regulator FadR n=1 Tax=Aliiglaciecola sp. CAU 1673 TaxID=3032595 RepID=UPI0023DBE001|nr:fatty acid metabolism transcriptional regulator FadR [Aliiglaciecola sp. CAU 1673]MDF2179532.1 fatty acid metabolism transcriptional regulator FadR [Aliiglaciecola sp. CAU 1673]
MIYKAQSPAGFAEEYIVESIWSGRFPPGTILPAERELSELIGVTRTTLREVLQRLARDGWLTIQHGKPTKVNNFWETCGLNILETLARLDQDGIPELVDQLLAARTSVSAVFIRGAIKNAPEKAAEVLKQHADFPEDGQAFAEMDYRINHDLAFASGNPVYVLMMNGFRGLYARIGGYYFANDKSRNLAKDYYAQLLQLAQNGSHEQVPTLIRKYGIASGKIWHEIRGEMPKDLVD